MPEQLQSTPDDHLLRRVRGEFLEMPGLCLTCEQARRLWGLDHDTCSNLLNGLVDLKFLIRVSDGRYTRLTDGGGASTLRMPTADIGLHSRTRQELGDIPFLSQEAAKPNR